MFIDADNLAETLTLRTGTSGRIEGEHLVVGLLERHAVGLETLGEIVGQTRGGNHQAQFAVTLVKGCLSRVNETGDGVLGIIDGEAVNDEIEV